MIYEIFIAIFLLLINYLFGKSNRKAYILALIYSIIMVVVYIKSTVYIAALNQAEAAWLYIYGYIRSGKSGRKTTRFDKNAYILSSILSIGMGVVIYSIRWKSEWTGLGFVFNSLNLEMLINTGSTIMLFLVARGRIEAYYVAALVNLSVAIMLVSADMPRYVLAAANGLSVIFYWGAVRIYFLIKLKFGIYKYVLEIIIRQCIEAERYGFYSRYNKSKRKYWKRDERSIIHEKLKCREAVTCYWIIPIYFLGKEGFADRVMCNLYLHYGCMKQSISSRHMYLHKKYTTFVIWGNVPDSKVFRKMDEEIYENFEWRVPVVLTPPKGIRVNFRVLGMVKYIDPDIPWINTLRPPARRMWQTAHKYGYLQEFFL